VGKVASLWPRLANSFLASRLTKSGAKFLGLTSERALPAYDKQPFRQWFRQREGAKSDKKVVFFTGCSINHNEVDLGRAVIEVLEHNGFEVIIPNQKCCGVPLVANGRLEEARRLARYNLQQLLPLVERGYKVITACTSGTLALKREWVEILELPEALQLSPNVYDIAEFLLDLSEQGELNRDFGPVYQRVGYHEPCHLSAQGIGVPAVEVLKLVPELDVEEIAAGCCGLSGTYGFKAENHANSMAVGERLFQAVNDAGFTAVTSDCPTCRMQISHGTQVRTVHPIIFLREAYEKGGKDSAVPRNTGR
jgi:glycerol-3-phosphate dehydrogenase subunit C